MDAEATIPVVGVRFKQAGKIYYFDPGGHDLRPGDHVIVETARGVEYGHVVIKPRPVPASELMTPVRGVLRKATLDDEDQVAENRRLADAALQTCQERAAAHGLEMRIVSAEYTFDRSKLVVHFSAEGRVDFRDLLRDLGARLKVRLELRQIGVRDEAKLIGGLGPCGRILCCTSFLAEFEPVSIRMAKDQNLSLSPTKLTGLCGRLKCCLRYENDTYVETRALLPREGARVRTRQGTGRVVGLDFLGRRVRVRLDDDTVVEFPHNEVAEAQ
ncbi:MAG TPA: stage 0 sporulation family protein [Bacillota bacterium]